MIFKHKIDLNKKKLYFYKYMTGNVTFGVLIAVRSYYREDLSDPINGSYFFNYEISIENQNSFKVQLLEREWHIFDSLNGWRLVSGPGVIGEQPVLSPNEKFTYTSGCDLRSEIGEMEGNYTFRNMENGSLFHTLIPKFKLEFPAKLN